jgi:hypothetical protein
MCQPLTVADTCKHAPQSGHWCLMTHCFVNDTRQDQTLNVGPCEVDARWIGEVSTSNPDTKNQLMTRPPSHQAM